MLATSRFGAQQIIIILLALTTAIIHFSRAAADPEIRVLFTLNGLGYLVLAGALYTPLPLAANRRRRLRAILIGYTAVTIALYIVWGLTSGDWSIPLGPIDKLVELALIALLWREKF